MVYAGPHRLVPSNQKDEFIYVPVPQARRTSTPVTSQELSQAAEPLPIVLARRDGVLFPSDLLFCPSSNTIATRDK